MGFSHSWEIKEALTDDEWKIVVGDADRLLEGLAELKKERSKLKWGMGFWEMARVFAEKMDKEPYAKKEAANLADSNKREINIREGHDDSGSEVGKAGCLPFTVSPEVGGYWAKTGAQKYDRVLLGLLMSMESLRPGAVKVTQTDGDDGDEYWTFIRDWAEKVLGKTLAVPEGAPGAEMDKARRERMAFSEDAHVVHGGILRKRI